MTDDERLELVELEGKRPLTVREEDRLHTLRLRAAGVMTWREVIDAYGEHVAQVMGPESEATGYPAWFKPYRPTEAELASVDVSAMTDYCQRHQTILPPPADDDLELE
jgi:hypothetical protein